MQFLLYILFYNAFTFLPKCYIMKAMKQIIIHSNDANQRLDRYLAKTFDRLPRSLMYKEIRKKNIKINKKRCTPEQMLCAGDVLTLYLKDDVLTERKKHHDFLAASKDLCVVYEDENLLIVNKKAGLLCHPDGREYIDTLIARIKRYLFEKGDWSPQEATFAPALANRIDRNTAGLVIAAKNADALRELTGLIQAHRIKKFYLAVTDGIPQVPEQTLTAFLLKDEKRNKVSVYQQPQTGAKKIVTHYRVLQTEQNRALVEIELRTGRTHQIRAHLASIGCPLAGDGKYGRTQGRFRQALFSYKLEFHVPQGYLLSYLNQQTFTADIKDFLKQFTGVEYDER